jgi:hypothetical protein
VVYRFASKVASAEGKLEEALELDPGLPGARFALARARARQGDLPGAAQMLVGEMELCLPCTTGLEDDPDLEDLRKSEQWSQVQEAHAKHLEAWKKVLGSEGTFVLVGFGRMVRDQVWDSVDTDRSDRGRVYFYHEASRRFLPVGLGRDVAGFMVDPAGKGVHAISWGGWTAGSNSLPPRWSDMSVWSLDLTTMNTHRAKLPGEISSAGVWVQGGAVHVTFLQLDARGEQQWEESWFTATCVGDGLEGLTRGKEDGTPSQIDPAGSAANKKVCIQRLDGTIEAQRYLLIDAFCGDHHPCQPASRRSLWSRVRHDRHRFAGGCRQAGRRQELQEGLGRSASCRRAGGVDSFQDPRLSGGNRS